LHIQSVELQELQLLISRIAGNASVDDFDTGRWRTERLIQAALNDLSVELSATGISGEYERISEKQDSEVLRVLCTDLAVTKT
jgi:hypothetical protein